MYIVRCVSESLFLGSSVFWGTCVCNSDLQNIYFELPELLVDEQLSVGLPPAEQVIGKS